MPELKDLFAKVEAMRKANVKHKTKGYRLQDLRFQEILDHLQDEVREVVTSKMSDAFCEELADVLGVLVHLSITQAMPESVLIEKCLKKLDERFEPIHKKPTPMQLLERFAAGHVVEGAKHYFNAHFPGLHSIVLDNNQGNLTRAFIAQPALLHKDLQEERGRFLWHAHGYAFKETTITGCCENICVKPGASIRFHEYEIDAGITADNKIPTLRRCGRDVLMDVYRRDVCKAGESFEMEPHEIHRVVFRPDRITKWFACVVEEKYHCAAPSTVYSEHELLKVPDAEKLYVRVDNAAARNVVERLLDSMKTVSVKDWKIEPPPLDHGTFVIDI